MLIENIEALKNWLIEALQPICDADPITLAKYVVALVKKDKTEAEHRELCSRELDVFLQEKTPGFVTILFESLEKKTYLAAAAKPKITAPIVSGNNIVIPTVDPVDKEPQKDDATENVAKANPVAEQDQAKDKENIRKIPQGLELFQRSRTRSRSPARSPIRRTQSPHGRSPLRNHSPGRRSPLRDRSPGRRSPLRDRSPGRRSPLRNRSPGRRSPLRDRSPGRRSPLRDRSPGRRSPLRDRSPGRRSPGRRSPLRDRDDRRRYFAGRRRPEYDQGARSRNRLGARAFDLRSRLDHRRSPPHRTRSFSKSKSRSRSPWSRSRSRERPPFRARTRSRSRSYHRSRSRSVSSRFSSSLSRSRSPQRSRSWSPRRPWSTRRSRSPGRRRPDSRSSTPPGYRLPSLEHPVERPESRPRCRDYDEKGFCMRGDMCPYDHGNDPVVVDDVSLTSGLTFPPGPQGPPHGPQGLRPCLPPGPPPHMMGVGPRLGGPPPHAMGNLGPPPPHMTPFPMGVGPPPPPPQVSIPPRSIVPLPHNLGPPPPPPQPPIIHTVSRSLEPRPASLSPRLEGAKPSQLVLIETRPTQAPVVSGTDTVEKTIGAVAAVNSQQPPAPQPDTGGGPSGPSSPPPPPGTVPVSVPVTSTTAPKMHMNPVGPYQPEPRGALQQLTLQQPPGPAFWMRPPPSHWVQPSGVRPGLCVVPRDPTPHSPERLVVASRTVLATKRPHPGSQSTTDATGPSGGPQKTDTPPHKRTAFDPTRLGPRRRPYDPNNATLEVKKIPRDLNNIARINEHFSKFGNIVNLKVCHEGDPEAALVTFSNNREANSAYRSTEPIFNNRFIKVFWHRKDSKDDNVATSQQASADNTRQVRERVTIPPAHKLQLNNVKNTTAISAAARSAKAKESIVVSPTGSLTKTVFNPGALSKHAAGSLSSYPAKHTLPHKTQDAKRKEAMKKKIEIQKQKQQLLQKYVHQQKILLEKIETNKNMTAEDKSSIIKTIKTLATTIEQLKIDLLSATTFKAAAAVTERQVFPKAAPVIVFAEEPGPGKVLSGSNNSDVTAHTPTSQSDPSTITTQSDPSTVTTQLELSTNTTQSGPSTVTLQSESSTITTPSELSTVTTPSGPSTVVTQSGASTNMTQSGPSTIMTPSGPSKITTPSGPMLEADKAVIQKPTSAAEGQEEKVAAATPKQDTASAIAFKTKQEAQKAILDTELDIINRGNEGADTSSLRRRVADLKREAVALGLLGRGGRGGRGRGRGAHHQARVPPVHGRGAKNMYSVGRSLDHRPKQLIVSGFTLAELGDVEQHVKTLGKVDKCTVDEHIPRMLVEFKTRKDAEQVASEGVQFKDKKLLMMWHKPGDDAELAVLTGPHDQQHTSDSLTIAQSFEDEGITPEDEEALLLAGDDTHLDELDEDMLLGLDEDEEEEEGRSWRR